MIVTWSDEQVKILEREVKKGTNYAVIGEMIGKTRNAVAGKVGRLGLTWVKPQPIKEIPNKKMPDIAPVIGSKTLADAQPNDCRYMTDKLICGKPIYKRSFCQEHYGLCWRPAGRL